MRRLRYVKRPPAGNGRTAQALLKILRNQFGTSEDAVFERVQQGRHGRSAGGWVWRVYSPSQGGREIGSPDTAGDCVKYGVHEECDRWGGVSAKIPPELVPSKKEKSHD